MAGGLAALSAVVSIIGIWTEPSGDAYVKTLAVLWILTALCYFLVPVLQRFTAAGATPAGVRVLAALTMSSSSATRSGGIDLRLEPGERLLLRRRA